MTEQTNSTEWTLYYHGLPNFKGKGRGEYVRLMFEVAGVPYTEINDPQVFMALLDRGGKPGAAGFPGFAPPLVHGPNDLWLSQTPAVCAQLGKLFNLYPEPADEFKALQVALSVADFHSDGRASFHPKELMASYYEQIPEAEVASAKFAQGRLLHWLNHFEHIYTTQNPTISEPGSGYFFNNRLTYVDIVVYHVLTAAAFQFPEAYESYDAIPNIKTFRKRIEQLPQIVNFINSSRYKPFEGNSMM